MNWPFVSRGRFDDKVSECERLRSDLAMSQQDNKRLNNFIVWRVGGGVALDPNLLPESYRPKQPTVTETHTPIAGARTPGQARRVLSDFERDRDQEMFSQTTGIRPQPKPDPGQIAVVKRLNDTANEAVRAAGA